MDPITSLLRNIFALLQKYSSFNNIQELIKEIYDKYLKDYDARTRLVNTIDKIKYNAFNHIFNSKYYIHYIGTIIVISYILIYIYINNLKTLKNKNFIQKILSDKYGILFLLIILTSGKGNINLPPFFR